MDNGIMLEIGLSPLFLTTFSPLFYFSSSHFRSRFEPEYKISSSIMSFGSAPYCQFSFTLSRYHNSTRTPHFFFLVDTNWFCLRVIKLIFPFAANKSKITASNEKITTKVISERCKVNMGIKIWLFLTNERNSRIKIDKKDARVLQKVSFDAIQ